jgi:ribose/xylose/arabinose/galactoside ABC-type transport system permease subunit
VALYAFGNSNPLVLLPVSMAMDVRVAVCAHHTLLNVNTVVVFGVFLFVATLATNLVYLGLAFHVSGEVCNLDMAAGTGIFAMD